METPRKALRNKNLDNVMQVGTPIRIPPSPMLKNLGYGTGVNVYCLERSPQCGRIRSPLAIKRISKTANKLNISEYQLRLREEAKILRELNHPNIVGFKGFKLSEDGRESLVLECCQTSLGDIIEGRQDDGRGPLDANFILNMCADITKALAYLHNKAKLLHGDIKSYNILVKDDFKICKLCDFGVSLPLDENNIVDLKTHPNLGYIGTELWSAPEVLQNDEITDKADIFSFGLVIYETIALIPPHTLELIESSDENSESSFCGNVGENYDEDIDKNSDKNISALGKIGTRPTIPEAFTLSTEYNKVLEIFYICTNKCPEDRPSSKDLSTVLNTSLTE